MTSTEAFEGADIRQRSSHGLRMAHSDPMRLSRSMARLFAIWMRERLQRTTGQWDAGQTSQLDGADRARRRRWRIGRDEVSRCRNQFQRLVNPMWKGPADRRPNRGRRELGRAEEFTAPSPTP